MRQMGGSLGLRPFKLFSAGCAIASKRELNGTRLALRHKLARAFTTFLQPGGCVVFAITSSQSWRYHKEDTHASARIL